MNHRVTGRSKCGVLGCLFEQREGPGRVEGPSVKAQSIRLPRDGMRPVVWKMDVWVHPQGGKAMDLNDC